MNFAKPSSLPSGYLTEISNKKNSYNPTSSSDSYSYQEYEEDTDSDLSSEGDEDEFVNELQSRNEADDELASLFGSDESCVSEPIKSLAPIFTRPNNPIVQDRRFMMSGSSAPSLEEQRPCSTHLARPSYCVLKSRIN
eukprot:CAMPEP_0205806724 /NCGR_PEP_ID=MMETSP0205-20121125/10358_1 /ASSEMBLY_ACC=CAM_ASM_000278 /TAXON_ID=36767 /ORGANISM="Euplotes focardii, Strain TN1" /LENGTH=137 /DNA_ID=CAMNT_0053080049 /DNA_START=208 /DNA_END=621 /DNA_ORIENTATION=+